MHLDAHEKPPEYLRAKFKRYRGRRAQEVEADRDVLDFTRPDKEGIHENQASCVTAEQLHAAFRRLSWHDGASRALSLTDIMPSYDGLQLVDKQAYEVDEVPGI